MNHSSSISLALFFPCTMYIQYYLWSCFFVYLCMITRKCVPFTSIEIDMDVLSSVFSLIVLVPITVGYIFQQPIEQQPSMWIISFCSFCTGAMVILLWWIYTLNQSIKRRQQESRALQAFYEGVNSVRSMK